jgi:2-iminobutanoate/2-iminopropanoate deaminase
VKMDASAPNTGVIRVPSATGASYSAAAVVLGAGEWIFVAGQLGTDETGQLVGSTIAEQADACFSRIEDVLVGANASLEHLVRIGVFLVDLDGYNEFATVRAQRLSPNLPTSAAVGVNGLLRGALIEIEALAFRGLPT